MGMAVGVRHELLAKSIWKVIIYNSLVVCFEFEDDKYLPESERCAAIFRKPERRGRLVFHRGREWLVINSGSSLRVYLLDSIYNPIPIYNTIMIRKNFEIELWN